MTDPRHTRRWKKLAAQVLRDEHFCWLCKEPIDFRFKAPDPRSPTVDHVIPVDVAPDLAFERSNCRAAHWGCNSSRGKRMRATKIRRERRQSQRW